jgi:hypothetical protein
MQIDRAREAVTEPSGRRFCPNQFLEQKTWGKRKQSRRDRDVSAGPLLLSAQPDGKYSTDVLRVRGFALHLHVRSALGCTTVGRQTQGAGAGGHVAIPATREVAGVGSGGTAHRVATREVAGVGSGGTTPRTLHARTPRMG